MKVAMLTLAVSLSVGVPMLVGCNQATSQPPAQPAQSSAKPSPPPARPPVSINAEMVSLVDHAGHALWDVEREGNKPKTHQDWENIAEHATQLAAAGALIALPGTGVNDVTLTQQADWQKWSRALSDAGMAALKASQAMNVEALVAANSQLVDVCENCHKEFKPALPSEGINHKHMHAVPTP
jgi:hypothetical protein